ncbi:DEAD/DEAH box helicase family protein [Methanoculleus bourgensis]|uniref:DEAD/DEAH box helicase family protein n=1 Tax=Methanoculleus bourgensis TaxID=83986 RepID=UPI003B94CEC6
MAKPRGRKNGPRARQSSKEEILRLWLVRCTFGNSLFGMKSFQDFQQILAKIDEGESEDGHTHFCHVLKSDTRFRKDAHVTLDELLDYDDNIMRHMHHINAHRDVPIRLKYFQWLAALFTEAYLDRYFQSPGKLASLVEDSVIAHIKETLQTLDAPYDYRARFMPSMDDLRKCAYWMATGSGKTFLMHLAYLQFQHYNTGPYSLDIDRILLITPNADLTAQHLREMRMSGIPCTEFDATGFGGYFQQRDEEVVNVIEITRFTEDKQDGGFRRVDVESFGSKNLIFVDEAHKGSGGEKWKLFRSMVAREGFTFEYSATFGQAAASRDNDDNLADFAKTILFDYSYPHFYNDGYGKEYRILNVNKATHETYRVLLANLLTYYEQKLVFEDLKDIATAKYNIADPLWIFVGSKVNVSGAKSDVLTVVKFLQKILTERDWVLRTTAAFLQGQSGLIHEKTRHDIFDPAFPEQRLRYLRERGLNAEEIYDDMLRRIFQCSKPVGLTLVLLKNTDGEIGLKCGDNDFFGDIYVGDAPKFIKNVEEHEPQIEIKKIDHPSLFRVIDAPDSTVNILIGAKKFIEGWDCYRVSCMGLINIGKREGTEIIQLFGRGVRLRGMNNSLKRSTNDAGDQPLNLPLLETLNIFGVDAKYIGYLREFLSVEGVDDYKTVERQIPIKVKTDYLHEGLLIPHCEETGFEREQRFVLTREQIVPVKVDLLARVESEDSTYYSGLEADTRPDPVTIDPRYLDFIDWDAVYFALLRHKNTKGWKNMVFTKALLQEIINDPHCYTLYCADDAVNPHSFEETQKLQDVIVLILKKSLQTAYNRQKNAWMVDNVRIEQLSESHGNFEFRKYVIKVQENETDVLKAIDALLEHADPLYADKSTKFITNVYFENHLYQPLLTKLRKTSNKVTISPQGLNEGEEKLVRAIKTYIDDHTDLFNGKKVYLLRNIPKTGVGFYKNSWFYPDFIMWVVDDSEQRIVFLEPHGMVFSQGPEDEKVQLAEDIKEIEQRIHATYRSKGINCGISLDSFIISVSEPGAVAEPYLYKTKEQRKKHHVLSIHQSDFIEELFEFVLS